MCVPCAGGAAGVSALWGLCKHVDVLLLGAGCWAVPLWPSCWGQEGVQAASQGRWPQELSVTCWAEATLATLGEEAVPQSLSGAGFPVWGTVPDHLYFEGSRRTLRCSHPVTDLDAGGGDWPGHGVGGRGLSGEHSWEHTAPGLRLRPSAVPCWEARVTGQARGALGSGLQLEGVCVGLRVGGPSDEGDQQCGQKSAGHRNQTAGTLPRPSLH